MTKAAIIRPTLNVPQGKFLSMPQKFRAFVTGYGGGKTWAATSGLAKHFYEWPKVNAGYFAPTYRDIRDVFYPTVEECMYEWGLNVKVLSGVHEVSVFRGRSYLGTVKCRSMDDPGSIVGFKIGKALVDEIDVMPMEKAITAWRKILARMRYNIQGLPNGVDVATTPEGFRFVYSQFVKQVRENPSLGNLYGLVQASTYDNAANLPEDYIPSLLASYPANLIDAYINGQFVNLQTGTVYVGYDRKENASKEILQPGEIAFVGMDFNVGKMAAVIHVKREGMPHAVSEIVGGYDTPDMIRRLKEVLWAYESGQYRQTRQIRIYPDASGDSRKSVSASKTDLALLRDAGFVVCAPAANPPVKDRINAMNAMFCNAEGLRRYKVNADLCPSYAEALEQQPWGKNGEPDKTTGHDHLCDSGGYFIHQDYPIVKRTVTVTTRSW